MKKKIFNIAKYTLFALIGIGLLWFVTKDKDINKLLSYFKSANYLWVLIAALIGILSHYVRAIRWNLLIKETGYEPKPASTFYAVMVGYLANLAIPRIGEITRCGVLSKTKKMPMGMLVGTVISERAFDMLTLLLLMFITISLQFKFLSGFLEKYLFGPLGAKFENPLYSILFGLLFIIFLIGFLFIAYRFMLLPIIKNSRYFFKFKRALVNFSKGVKAIFRNKRKWLFLFYTLLLWILYTLMVYLCVFSLDETANLSFFDGITIMVLGSIGIVAPVPGGIGAYHFIIIALLTELYQIGAEAATSFAYIAHTSQMAVIILAGIISYFLLLFIQRKNK